MLSSRPNASLEPLIEYRMRDQVYSKKKEIIKYSFILIDSSLAVWLYVNPALTYAGNSLLRQTVFVSGCVGANFGLTFWSAESTFSYVNDLFKPEIVSRLTDHSVSRLRKGAGYMGLLVGGTLPSLLPSAAALQLGGGGSFERKLEAGGVLLGNLPQNTYGLLNFLNEHGASITNVMKYLACSRLFYPPNFEEEERRNKILSLKKVMIETFRLIQAQVFLRKNCQNLNNVPEGKILETLLSYLPDNDIEEKEAQVSSSNILTTVRSCMGLLGATLGVMDFPGYMMSTKSMTDRYFTHAGTSWTAASLINAIPIYMSAILGKKTFQTIFDSVNDALHGRIDPSLSYRLYKKATVLATLFSASLAFFSYCTSVQLVKENFPEQYQDVLGNFARASITMFNMYGAIGFADFLIRKYARYYGEQSIQNLIKLSEGIDFLVSDINEMSQDRFVECLEEMSGDVRKQLMRASKNNTESILQELLSKKPVKKGSVALQQSAPLSSVSIPINQRVTQGPGIFSDKSSESAPLLETDKKQSWGCVIS